jgi:hypothetical protein
MKSTKQQLASRGFVSEDVIADSKNNSLEEISQLLKSSQPCERTLGAKVSAFSRHEDLLPLLCTILENEKKTLYKNSNM